MNDILLSPAQARRSSQFERKMTIRRTNSGFHKPQEITFIDFSMFYNLILRAIQNKTKNSFIIYDFTSLDNPNSFSGDNVIKMQEYPGICDILLKKQENTKLIEIQKMLPKPKGDLFSKRMRFYNFIVINSDMENEFSKAFNRQVSLFFQDDPDVQMDILLNGGMHKCNEKFFTKSIENILLEQPHLDAKPEAQAWKMAINFQTLMKNDKIKETLIYKGDCKQFFRKYPFMKTYLPSLNNSTTLMYPNEVFYGRFFYGNWKHASSEEIFKNTKITHVLNMTQEVECYFENNQSLGVSYCQIKIEDLEDVNIKEHFEKGYRFLTEALGHPQNKVFVHCAQGKSRSATLVCVFFMRMYQWTFDQTIKYISDRREIACPNSGFADQLREFQLRCFNFEGEELTLQRKISNNYLHIVNESPDDFKTINENDEEDNSSTSSNEEEYFENGCQEDKLFQQVQLKYSQSQRQSQLSYDNTPINFIGLENNFININPNLSKDEQSNNINLQPGEFNSKKISIK